MSNNLVITILAAGEGKRMRSDLPKVLHLFNNIPMLVRIVQTSLSLKPKKIIVVTGKNHALIKETLEKYTDINKLCFVNQLTQLGTGDAINYCLPLYASNSTVLILNGDMPLINTTILNKFVENSYKANILIAKLDEPHGYGRIIYDKNGDFLGIVEEKNCTEDQRKINIINSGIYLFNGKLLKDYIPMITNQNVQNEYYLTDIVKIVKENAKINVDTYLIETRENKYIRGVNTPEELNELENCHNLS